MAIAVALPMATSTSSEPCCPKLACRYRPSQVRKILRYRDALRSEGFDPTEGLRSFLSPSQGYEMGRSNAGSSTTLSDAAEICADLEMARKAGRVDPVAISRFLCPFGEMDDALALAVDDEDDSSVDLEQLGRPRLA